MRDAVEDDAPAAQPPAGDVPQSVTAPATSAGGWPAVASSLEHVSRHPGVVRGTRALLAMNQPHGFDCPGCAWPEHEGRGPVEFCENGVKALAAEATRARADAAFFAAHDVRALAAQTDLWLGDRGRLTEPMVLRPGSTHYAPIGWDDAFALIGQHLRGLPHPDRAVFYTSGRTSNEAAFLWQLFVRRYGTNNLPDCSDMCHESSGVGLRETLGVGKGTVTLQDFDEADLIFVVGQNPGTNHPRMLVALRDAVRRGAQLISVNPLPEAALQAFAHPQDPLDLVGHSTPLASLHVPVRINGDVAFFQALSRALLDAERLRPGRVLDHDFIASHTGGFESFAETIRALDPDHLAHAAGVDRATIAACAERVLASKRIIVCWAMGLTQHENAVANVQSVVSFLLLRGNVGRPGAGVCPVRGHSNVQGDRTMGIAELMDDAFLDRLGARFAFAPPRARGMDTVATIQAMEAGHVDAFIALGGNFLSATPDTERVAAALRRVPLTVQISTKLNRSHLVTGRTALILPCLGRSERDAAGFVTVEDSMALVHRSLGVLAPASPALRSEPAIVAGIARATLGKDDAVAWESLAGDYDGVRDAIADVVPGFEQFNTRVRHAHGFALPNAARERRFNTVTGKARFTAHPLPQWDLQPGELLMMTIRSHDQFNTTIYGPDDRYRGVFGGRRVVLLNAADMQQLGVAEGALVDLIGTYAGHERIARSFRAVAYAIPRGCAATYFPEANVLVPLEQHAAKSRTPASKSVVITLRLA